jgi:hypothetical protein
VVVSENGYGQLKLLFSVIQQQLLLWATYLAAPIKCMKYIVVLGFSKAFFVMASNVILAFLQKENLQYSTLLSV